MANINVNASLYIAGPYAQFRSANCHFGLAISAGYGGSPTTPAEKRAWLKALYPWLLMTACDGVQLYVADDAGTMTAIGEVPATLAAPDPALDGFVAALKDSINEALNREDLFSALTLEWAGRQQDVTVTGTGAAPAIAPTAPAVPVPALLHSFATLPARLCQRLRSVVYFSCDAGILQRIGNTGTLIAIPNKIRYDTTGTVFDAPQQPVAQPVADPALDLPHFRAGFGAGDAPAVLTPGIVLDRIAAVLDAHTPAAFDLASGWLPVHTGADQQLTRVGEAVEQILHAEGNLGRIPPDRLAARVEVQPDGSSKTVAGWLTLAGNPVLLEQAQAFHALAITAARAIDANRWKREEAGAEARALRDLTAQLLLRALGPGGSARNAIYQEMLAEVNRQWLDIVQRVGGEFAHVSLAGEAFAQMVDLQFPQTAPTEARPATAGEGIEFCVGDIEERLVHQDAVDQSAVGMAEALQCWAGIGVLVRRAGNNAGGQAQPWRLATAGVPALGFIHGVFDGTAASGTDAWLREMQPAPLTAAFVNNLLSTDFTYHGMPMRTANPLQSTHAYSPDNGTDADVDTVIPFSLHSVGGVADAAAPGSEVAGWAACRTPPLVYGETYQLAAFGIGRAGGMPAELCGALPYVIDFAGLGAVQPPADRIGAATFLRRVPPGGLRLTCAQPGAPSAAGATAPQWPVLPAGVALRAREFLAARARQQAIAGAKPGEREAPADALPALVVTGDRMIAGESARTVQIDPPRLDEHTLSRWAMPAGAASPAAKQEAVRRLRGALQRLYDTRLQCAAQPDRALAPVGLPHDPAITAIRITARWVDAGGVERAVPVKGGGDLIVRLAPKDPTGAGEFFLCVPPLLQVVAADEASAQLVPPDGAADAMLRLPPGAFAIVSVSPLVAAGDWQRFDPDAMKLVVATDPPPGYTAFQPDRFVVEHAVSALPDAAELYRSLEVQSVDSGVRLRLAGQPPGLAFVDAFALDRQRWIWRNRPLIDFDQLRAAADDPAEQRRLLASGLPAKLLSDNADVRDGDDSRAFDAIGGLDRGLASRAGVATRFPRRDADGGPEEDALLLLDTLDGVGGAQYLRYGLTVTSRYAPLFKSPPAAAVRAELKNVEHWRRASTPFRGVAGLIKPPKVLAVIPLTHGLPYDPKQPSGAAATPLLVLLDEVWFREYGVGERLEARLALENADIGEEPQEPRPYRAGKLPDHYLADGWTGSDPYDPKRYFNGVTVNEAADAAAPVLLDAFGPFGYSFDRSGNEALANATAFVVYPPPGVGPHWAMFLRFARVLDRPSAGERSAPTDPYAVYTLPDAYRLAGPSPAAAAGNPPPRMLLKSSGAVVTEGLALELNPVGDPTDRAARGNYLYCLLVSDLADDGGRGVTVELPVAMVCLDDTAGSLSYVLPAAALPPLIAGRTYAARVIELLLDGKHAPQQSLRNATSLREFWRQLLPGTGEQDSAGRDLSGYDAPAMVRRVSIAFSLVWEG